MIRTNEELTRAIHGAIAESGQKKLWIAEQLGMNNQNFSRFLSKKSLSLDDANKVLNLIGYELVAEIQKTSSKKDEKYSKND